MNLKLGTNNKHPYSSLITYVLGRHKFVAFMILLKLLNTFLSTELNKIWFLNYHKTVKIVVR